MIAEAFLNVWYAFIQWLFGLLPSFSLPQDFINGAVDTVKWIYWINLYIPLDTLVIIVPLVITVWLGCAIASAVLQLL